MRKIALLTLLLGCGEAASSSTAPPPESAAPAAALADASAEDASAAAADAEPALDAGASADASASAPDAEPPRADAELPAEPQGVRVIAESCDGPLGPLPGTSCKTLEIRCGGLDPIEVALRITPPSAGASPRGVVVFGSGGAGTGLWSGPASTRRMMSRLLRGGFTLVERQWLNERDAGWFQDLGGRGLPAVACRYATLLGYIDRTLRTGDQPLCATGNSGGSAELGFALTRTDAAELLDLAIPSSGPFHRMDLACDDGSDAAWQTECAALLARHCPSCATRGCSLGNGPKALLDGAYGASTPCTGRATPVDAARLAADSPVAPAARRDFPHTRIALLIGEQDEGPYAALSAALYEALSSEGADVSFSTEPATGHEFQSTDEGATRIAELLEAECVRRH